MLNNYFQKNYLFINFRYSMNFQISINLLVQHFFNINSTTPITNCIHLLQLYLIPANHQIFEINQLIIKTFQDEKCVLPLLL